MYHCCAAWVNAQKENRVSALRGRQTRSGKLCGAHASGGTPYTTVGGLKLPSNVYRIDKLFWRVITKILVPPGESNILIHRKLCESKSKGPENKLEGPSSEDRATRTERTN